jgi:pectinesterase
MNVVRISILLLLANSLLAQNTSGITGKRDHSYSNETALQTVKKDFPDAKLASSNLAEKVDQQFELPYCQTAGRTLTADVFTPKEKPNDIVFLFIHGGGWRSGNKSQHHELAIELAGRGYTVLTPEYRLSTEALYPAAIADIKVCLSWAKAKFPGYKIAVGGFSAGGQMAAFVASTQSMAFEEASLCPIQSPVKIDAAVDVDGILAFIHPESGEGDDRRGTSAATYYFGYSKTENPELWVSAGALAHVSEETPPFLFINSREERMHAGREDFIEKLKGYGVYSEVHTFSDAPHSFPQMERWFLPTVDLIDSFLKKTLNTSNK